MSTVAQSAEPEPLLTIASAARHTGVAEWTLRRLVRDGRIPSVDVAGARRVRLSAVQAAIREVNAEAPCAK
jgi:excisionase family DNA binding protein